MKRSVVVFALASAAAAPPLVAAAPTTHDWTQTFSSSSNPRHSPHPHPHAHAHAHPNSRSNSHKVQDALEWYGVESIAELPSAGPRPTKLSASELPVNHDWRNVDGVRYATGSKTQQIPHICGACWAFAATGSLSDRVRIAAKGAPIEVDLSPQNLLNCHTDAGSCLGGNSLAAFESVYNSTTGLTDLTCQPYEGVDYSNWGESDCSERMCLTSDLYGQTYWVNGTRVFIESFGAVDATDLDGLRSEVLQNGPIACYMYAHSDSFEDYTGGIITDATQYSGITHVVSLVGWGTDEETGLDYWVVRNSFGTFWGEQGYYRVQRGINAFNMETGVCEYATPTQESVDNLVAKAVLPPITKRRSGKEEEAR